MGLQDTRMQDSSGDTRIYVSTGCNKSSRNFFLENLPMTNAHWWEDGTDLCLATGSVVQLSNRLAEVSSSRASHIFQIFKGKEYFQLDHSPFCKNLLYKIETNDHKQKCRARVVQYLKKQKYKVYVMQRVLEKSYANFHRALYK